MFRTLLLTAVLLTACAAPEVSTAPVTPTLTVPNPISPTTLTGCRKAISAFKGVINSDLETGDATKDVHARMTNDLKPAENTCASGQEGAALSQLAGVKIKYGYPNQ